MTGQAISQLSLCSELSLSQTSFQSQTLDFRPVNASHKQELELTIIIRDTEYEVYDVNQYQVARLMRNYTRSGYFNENLRLNDIEIRWGYCNQSRDQEQELSNYQDKVEEVMKKAGVKNSNQIYFRFLDKSESAQSQIEVKKSRINIPDNKQAVFEQSASNGDKKPSEIHNRSVLTSIHEQSSGSKSKMIEAEHSPRESEIKNDSQLTVPVKLAEKVLKEIKEKKQINKLIKLLKKDNVPETLIQRVKQLSNILKVQSQARNTLKQLNKQLQSILEVGSSNPQPQPQPKIENEHNDIDKKKLSSLIHKVKQIKEQAHASQQITENSKRMIMEKDQLIQKQYQQLQIMKKQQAQSLTISTITFKRNNVKSETMQVFGMQHKCSFDDRQVQKCLQDEKHSQKYLVKILQANMNAKLTECQCVMNLNLQTVEQQVAVDEIVLNTVKLCYGDSGQKGVINPNILMVFSLNHHKFCIFSNHGISHKQKKSQKTSESDGFMNAKFVNLLIQLNHMICFPLASNSSPVKVGMSTINMTLLTFEAAFLIKMNKQGKLCLKTDKNVKNTSLVCQIPEIFSNEEERQYILQSFEIYKMKFEGQLEKDLKRPKSQAIILE